MCVFPVTSLWFSYKNGVDKVCKGIDPSHISVQIEISFISSETAVAFAIGITESH